MNSRKTVLLHGAGFHNFGAWLMLETVMSELVRRTAPEQELVFCVPPNPSIDYENARRHRLRFTFQPYSPDPRKRARHTMSKILFPAAMRERLGIVPIDEIDMLVDVSGYAYGDPWSTRHLESVAKMVKVLERRSRPVVFLPQAFGPFGSSRTRAAMRSVLETASLVVPRDETSFRELVGLDSAVRDIEAFPDITIFSEPEPVEVPSRYVCIVPNERMVSTASAGDRAGYIDLLASTARAAVNSGFEPVLLNHASDAGDLALVSALERALDDVDFRTVSGLSPRQAKDLLGKATFVVASRYHAIVGALSQATPAIAIGWADKYPELLADFGVPELAFDQRATWSDLEPQLASLLNENTRARISNTIRDRKSTMASANEHMWRRVIATLGLSHAEGSTDTISVRSTGTIRSLESIESTVA